jgi:hypothetical protein
VVKCENYLTILRQKPMDKKVVVKVKEHKTKDKEKKQLKSKYNTFIMVDQTTQKVNGKTRQN